LKLLVGQHAGHPAPSGLCLPITVSALLVVTDRSPRQRLAESANHRAFSVAGPVYWNYLPDYLKSSDFSCNCFRQQLKAFLLCKY